MARGGAREGAGRKAGVPNKVNAEKRKAIEESGITPLDYMLKLLRDETSDKEDRMWAAEKAAPYIHARLAAINHSGSLTVAHETALEELDDDQ